MDGTQPDGIQQAVTPHIWIPTRDGTHLSAAVHWPPGADPEGGDRRFPALIEYHPYRKDDCSAARADDHDFFARHEYVSVRLDVRGTGSSGGVNTDEYMAAETLDGYDAVEWLASQPWSNGAVGMFGSSYGGFTCYQVAMLRPPHLKAIVPIYATDDRYTDDCHYKGGSLKAYYDTGTYGTMMIALNALPPGRAARGQGWEARWRERMEANTPYMLNWLANQTDGPYWRPGSLRGQYGGVEAATFIIGGWQDGYPNPPLRAYEALRCPKRLMVGPWNHSRPSVAVPGPRIDYLHEMRRWFDLWLKGEDDGFGSEPPVAYYVQSFDPPDPSRDLTTGEWRAERSLPPAGRRTRRLYLAGDGALRQRSGTPTKQELEYDPSVGASGGLWSGGLPFGLPSDQGPDEARSLVFTSRPLRTPLTVVGIPRATLQVSSTARVPALVVKLADVSPEGESALVCRGVLNLTRRDGMTDPTAMRPGTVYQAEVELDATAWRFEAGHRARIGVSGADFPNSWPTPEHHQLTLRTGGDTPSCIELPVVGESMLPQPKFRPSDGKPAPFDPGRDVWSYCRDVMTGKITLEVGRSSASEVAEQHTTSGSDHLSLSVDPTDPAVVEAVGTSKTRLDEPDASFEASARQRITSSATDFEWQVDLEVSRDGEVCFERRWERKFPRELM